MALRPVLDPFAPPRGQLSASTLPQVYNPPAHSTDVHPYFEYARSIRLKLPLEIS